MGKKLKAKPKKPVQAVITHLANDDCIINGINIQTCAICGTMLRWDRIRHEFFPSCTWVDEIDGELHRNMTHGYGQAYPWWNFSTEGVHQNLLPETSCFYKIEKDYIADHAKKVIPNDSAPT